jgi:NAD(P)-dependent dehydrogenase (short-subunit alcohol dehydrogenase family)
MDNSNDTNSRRQDDKVAIISGASRGIGAAVARRFAREGAKVVLAARSQAELERIAEEIKANGGQAMVVPTDFTQPASVESLVQRTLEAYGRLDAAFNNAGEGQRPIPLAEIGVEEFNRNLQINLGGVFLAMKYEIPAILASGGGAIVNMSSTAGLSGVKGVGAYAAGKHGVIGLTKSAALDYAAQNLRINALAPGPILNDRISMLSEEMRLPIMNAIPMRRIGKAEEVASAAVWLCSDEASFITGAVFSIDGGRMAGAG